MKTQRNSLVVCLSREYLTSWEKICKGLKSISRHKTSVFAQIINRPSSLCFDLQFLSPIFIYWWFIRFLLKWYASFLLNWHANNNSFLEETFLLLYRRKETRIKASQGNRITSSQRWQWSKSYVWKVGKKTGGGSVDESWGRHYCLSLMTS